MYSYGNIMQNHEAYSSTTIKACIIFRQINILRWKTVHFSQPNTRSKFASMGKKNSNAMPFKTLFTFQIIWIENCICFVVREQKIIKGKTKIINSII